MFLSFQEAIYYLTYDQVHWLISILMIMLFASIEYFYPRVQSNSKKSRVLAILAIGIFSYAAVWLFKSSIYLNVVSFFLNFQIYSLSKADIPVLAVYIFSILLIDFLVFIFHFLSHKVIWLWKLHSVHHADEHVDAKTGVLHHPFESLSSMIFVLFFSVVLGLPLVALIMYASIATLHNFFAHANIALPESLDRILRLVIITPDMHRTHHFIDIKEGNSNFGQLFSFWDRLFGTYVSNPATGEAKLIMGLAGKEKPKEFSLKGLLIHPFSWFDSN